MGYFVEPGPEEPDLGQKEGNVRIVHGRGALGNLQKRRGRLLLRDEGIFGCLDLLHGVGSSIDQGPETCVPLSQRNFSAISSEEKEERSPGIF